VQPQHRSVSDHHVSEAVDISIDSIGNSDLVETALDEVAEVLCECRRQPVIEAAGRECLVGRRVVTSSEASECSALACGEAEHERPHQDGTLKLALSLDHTEFLGVLFEELAGKQCRKPTHNSR